MGKFFIESFNSDKNRSSINMQYKQNHLVPIFLGLIIILITTEFSFGQIKDEIYDDEKIDNTVITNDKKNKNKKELKDRKESKFKADNIFVGTTFSFAFGNPFFLDISPFGGYLFGKYLGVGIGATYVYQALFYQTGPPDEVHIYGGRLFVNVRPFPEIKGVKGLYAHVEGEYLNTETGFTNSGTSIRSFVPAINVGLGYNTAFDKGFAFMTEILINAMWFSQRANFQPTVYNAPWQYRIGVYYAF